MAQQPHRRRGRPPSGGREAIVAATLRLLRERGIAQLTTREVARCAGVSEASVFYHYRDRAGLLAAAFAAGLAPLQALGEEGLAGDDRRAVLRRFGAALERFLDEVLRCWPPPRPTRGCAGSWRTSCASTARARTAAWTRCPATWRPSRRPAGRAPTSTRA